MEFSIFEAAMLVCFGISWPVSIVRSIRARSAKRKSLLFLILIFLAYTSGILHKSLVRFDIVIVLYILNMTMILIDIALYIRNTKLDKAKEKEVKYETS